MSDPLIFDSSSPRFGLPYLFVGQSQKEAHVNEALSLTDGLLHCAIEGQQNGPPAAPEDGQAWLVGSSPAGDWSGQAGKLALRQSGNWIFVVPRDGMRLLDRSSGQDLRYHGGWLAPAAPAAPAGGTTVDAEARTAISLLVDRLREAGIFPES